MGLRHRTAISMIRLQRRQAEANEARALEKKPARAERSVYFSQIDPITAQRRTSLSAALHRHDQDDSQRLLQRLRQALHPWSNEQSQASKEYASLQDELLRLSQHIAQQKNQALPQIWDDQAVASFYTPDAGQDSQPYRTIRIVMSQTHAVERLDVTPLDLSRYRQTLPPAPVTGRGLCLVTAIESPAPEAKDLLIDEEVQLGQATAKLTQQSLETPGSSRSQISISPEVALSLLDN